MTVGVDYVDCCSIICSSLMILCMYSKGTLLFEQLKVFHLRPSVRKLFFLVYGRAEHLQSIARVFYFTVDAFEGTHG